MSSEAAVVLKLLHAKQALPRGVSPAVFIVHVNFPVSSGTVPRIAEETFVTKSSTD